MKKRVTKILFVLLFMPFCMVYSVEAKNDLASDSKSSTYEMQRAIHIDNVKDTIKVYKKSYDVSPQSENIINQTKTDYAYEDFSTRSNSEGRKSFYDKLFDAYKNIYEDGDINSTQIVEGEVFYYVSTIKFSEDGLSYKEALDTYFMFRHDNPIFYYSSNVFLASDDSMYVLVFKEYKDANVRKAFNAQIESSLEEYATELSGCSSNYEKIKKIHDLICENMYYEYIDGVPSQEPYAHNILGALIEGKGVCESYARAFEFLLNYFGIDNIFVTGKSFNQNHAWNMVELNGNYYWVDCTWDDQETGIIYNYFMKGEDLWENHEEDKPTGILTFLYLLPDASESSYNENLQENFIDVYKNGEKIGSSMTFMNAFALLTDDVNAEYEIVLANDNGTFDSAIYSMPVGEWPIAKTIKLTSSKKELNGGGFVYPSIEFKTDTTINSDLVVTYLNLRTDTTAYIENGYKCLDLNIGDHKITFSENGSGNIGSKLIEDYSNGGTWNRTGLNVKGSNKSSIVVENTGDTNLSGDEYNVGKIEGNFITLNVGKAQIDTVNALKIGFQQDYNISINNMNSMVIQPDLQQPTNANATSDKILNITNIGKYKEHEPTLRIYDVDEDYWPTININGTMNSKLNIEFPIWEPALNFHKTLINIKNNDMSKITMKIKDNDSTMNLHKESDGSVVICRHNYENGECTICGDLAPALDAPALKIASENGKIKLSWTEISNSSEYHIYRSTSSNGNYEYLGATKNILFIDNDAKPGIRYYYKVKAISSVNDKSDSKFSSVISYVNYINISTLKISLSNTAIYTGSAITPTVSIVDGSKTLKINTDYTVTYKNNINPGTASVIITGKGNYVGSKTLTFTINKRNAGNTTVTMGEPYYTGKAITPTVIVKYGNTTLKLNTDYTLTYKNNVNVGSASVTITGKGNYTGSKVHTFKINPRAISLATVTVLNQNCTGTAINNNPTVKYNGYTLIKGKDYTLAYKNNVVPGTSSVIITGKGNFAGSVTKTFKILLTKVSGLTQSTQGTNYITLKWTKNNQMSGYQVYYATSKNGTYVRIGTTSNNTTLTMTRSQLQAGKNYYFKIRGYKKVNGKNYFGEFSNIIEGTTLPEKVAIKTPTSKSGETTISWIKQTLSKGYEIYYSLNKTSGYKKLTTIGNNTTTLYKTKGLTKGKTYYIRIRAYKKLNNKNYYGALSDIKSIKVK